MEQPHQAIGRYRTRQGRAGSDKDPHHERSPHHPRNAAGDSHHALRADPAGRSRCRTIASSKSSPTRAANAFRTRGERQGLWRLWRLQARAVREADETIQHRPLGHLLRGSRLLGGRDAKTGRGPKAAPSRGCLAGQTPALRAATGQRKPALPAPDRRSRGACDGAGPDNRSRRNAIPSGCPRKPPSPVAS